MIPMEMHWDGEGHSLRAIEEDRTQPVQEDIPEICWQPAPWVDVHTKFKRRIVCAANRYELKEGGHIIVPSVRHYSKEHHHIIDRLPIVSEYVGGDDQGFVDQYSNYWTREEAVIIAKHAGQLNTVRKKTGPANELFSEDLY